ncbi:MAG: hypothetical protein RR310_03965 [Eubacterium sp.]
MKIRDKKLDNEINELQEMYKTCKQEVRRIGNQLNEDHDHVELSDLNYQRGLYEGRLQSTAEMLSFFQDYNALPLEVNYEKEKGDQITEQKYDRLIQLIYHHLASYVFELSKEKSGGVVHQEELRTAMFMIQNLVEVLNIMYDGQRYYFYDGKNGNWAGVYCKAKEELSNEKIKVILKINIL